MAHTDEIDEELVLIDPVTGWRVDPKRIVVRRIRRGVILRALAVASAFFFGACLFFIGLPPCAAVVTILAASAICIAAASMIARLVSRETNRHSRRH